MSSSKETSFVFDERYPSNVRRCADWDYWLLVPTCKVKDAVYLSFNIEPRSMGEVESLAIGRPILMPKIINDRVSLAVENLSINGGKLPIFSERHSYQDGKSILVRLDEFGHWARYVMKWVLPSEFPAKASINPITSDLTHLNEAEGGRGELTQPQDTKDFSGKERNKMLSVILAMAIDKYGYNPKANRNPASGTSRNSIKAALEKIGLEISEDTIKKYLKEAYENHKDSIK